MLNEISQMEKTENHMTSLIGYKQKATNKTDKLIDKQYSSYQIGKGSREDGEGKGGQTQGVKIRFIVCLLYTSPSPRDLH